MHRWWVCPKWDAFQNMDGRKLACLGAETDWQPKCLWEFGLLPSPTPGDCPPAPASGAERGKPRQWRLPGAYLIYTDASAMRPKDPYLRRAACAFWAGDRPSDSAAWSLPRPVQTVYRAKLFAVLVAFDNPQGDLEIVSDCKEVVDEAERIRGGGKVSPTSKHADLWAKYGNALSAGGVRRVRVRWVPSHGKEGSDSDSPSDKTGNDHADKLANAQAKRIGPMARQGKLYDRQTQQLYATQSIQLKIFAAYQATEFPKAQDQAPSRPPRGPRLEPGPGLPQEAPHPYPGTRGIESVRPSPYHLTWDGRFQVHHLRPDRQPQEG